ncbi:MAG: polysaccharide deacetylase family protein [Clostridiales bacterium]|nr:polysaccharide deacetylase family protein [Clostridiales bacterium]
MEEKIALRNMQLKLSAIIIIFVLIVLFVTAYVRKSEIVWINELVPISKGNTDKKVVAFACNVYEGSQQINEMISVLENKKVKMSFFLGGIWVNKNRELVKNIYEKGYDLQNHGYYHKRPSTLNRQNNIKEVRETEELIYKITGHKTKLFEPPYGDYDENTLSILSSLNYKVITWSIDTIDWRDDASREVIMNRIRKKLHPGAIILIHPKSVTANVLEEMIEYIKGQGYEIITVNEIIN